MTETTEMIKAIANDSKGRIDRIVANYEQLEKENAELKEKNKWYSEQVCNKECAEVWGQLTKAKEIIKELLDTQRCLDPYGDIFKNRILKAEQFLKECKE